MREYVTVGLLLRGRFRRLLKEAKVAGYDISWLENWYLLDSVFTVKGKDALAVIRAAM